MDSTMVDEPNGKFDWVPLTPVKSIPSRYDYNSADKRVSQETLMDEVYVSKNGARDETPKRPSTPKPLEERNSSITELVSNSYKKSSRRKLDFKILKVCDKISNSQLEVKTNLQDSVSKSNYIRVYKRILRPNECAKNSRKLGPNFPSLFKKARKSQLRRTTFDKFITFIRLVRCVTPAIQKKKNVAEPIKLSKRRMRSEERPLFEKCLKWVIRRKRSEKKSITKSDLLFHVNDCSKLRISENFLRICSSIRTQLQLAAYVEVQELMRDNNGIQELYYNESIQESFTDFEMLDAFLPEHISNDSNARVSSFMSSFDDEEEDDVSINQNYDFYTEALFDFSSQMIDGLHIDDESIHFSGMVDGLHSDDVTNQLLLWNQNQNGAIVVCNKAKTKKRACKREVDEGQLKKFISAMHLKQGEGHFSPWEGSGSVVDYVVGLYLTQKCKDLFPPFLACSEAFVAFMNLKSRFEVVVSDGVTNSAIQDTELLSIDEGPFDEVVPEQLLMVEKEGPTSCPSSSHTEVDSEDGNVNSSQTESTLGERKEKNNDKQDTSHWCELCVKYTTKKITGCNRDSIDWEAVRQTPYSDLAVILMKRGPKILLAGTIKDFLDWMVKDRGSINLEWLRGLPLEKANEYLLSIPCLGLKKTDSTDIDRVRGAFVASPSSFPGTAVPSEGP